MTLRICVLFVGSVLVALYQLVILRGLIGSCQLLRLLRHHHRKMKQPVLLASTIQLFNLSSIFGTTGNICFAIYICASLQDELPPNQCITFNESARDRYKVALGSAAMLYCLDLCQYLTYSVEYGKSIQILFRGLPKVGRLMTVFVPFFVAFMVFGHAAYGREAVQFSTYANAASTLFAILNGDEIRNTYVSVGASNSIGHIYLSLWLFFSMYVILNMSIAIIEDTWLALKSAKKRDGINASGEVDIVMDLIDDLYHQSRAEQVLCAEELGRET